ncbi:hypothetical protein rosag_14190 [Roseisolibacter agri]|uniref:Uncharacterized protein n=1 Tax=Roseisolibacter agri TaxID=2014610 RepID=A0AA37Q9P4_9BACT|nr:hypothetical protein rosag_14190 [Roseisolibacter agri]
MLLAALAASQTAAPASAGAQQARRAVVAVLPLVVHPAATRADSVTIAPGIAALLESALVADSRIRIAPAPATPATPASHAVHGEILRVGDSVRVTARVLRLRDSTVVALDTLAVASDEVPRLVDDLADAVTEALDLVPPPAGTLRRGGGPVFRPPRPPVPLVAMSLYSRAVAARAAGDADTAARLLREVVSAAPRWDQPKRELAALKRRS